MCESKGKERSTEVMPVASSSSFFFFSQLVLALKDLWMPLSAQLPQ